jgi:predicted nucleotidyltransferase
VAGIRLTRMKAWDRFLLRVQPFWGCSPAQGKISRRNFSLCGGYSLRDTFIMEDSLEIKDKAISIPTQRVSVKNPSVPFADKIPFITSTILESADKRAVKKIILFGSYAYGKPNKHSDIDICVIVPNKRKSRSLYLKMATALFENKITPVDLLVYREKDFNIGIEKNDQGIESVINAKGKILYG